MAPDMKIADALAGSKGQASPTASTACGDLTPRDSRVSSPSRTPQPRDRYRVGFEILGGGATGIVQKGVDVVTGREVAVKRLQCDDRCPIRFLEVRAGDTTVLHAEGYAPARAWATPFSGPLIYDPLNAYAADPFFPGTVNGCVVLVHRDGGASFTEKVANARCGGAAGVIFVNGDEDVDIYSDTQVALPSMLITRSDGLEAIEIVTTQSRVASTNGSVPSHAVWAEIQTDVGHELAICLMLGTHPHIVEVFDVWEYAGMPVIAMELFIGGRLQTSWCDATTGLKLITQMLAGVAHLHAHGICHRDLKPDNILLAEAPDVRLALTDFSMSSVARRMRVPCGSVRYLAPEVLGSDGYSTQRDMWSAGVIAHELLFAGHPFQGLSDDELLRWLVTAEAYEMPRESGGCGAGGLEDFVGGLLQKDPSLRLTALQALSHLSLHTIALPCSEDNMNL